MHLLALTKAEFLALRSHSLVKGIFLSSFSHFEVHAYTREGTMMLAS